MRLVERITIILFAAVLTLYIGSRLYRMLIVDDTAPTIICQSDTVEIGLGDDKSALLQGISAHDNRDGDLTGEVMIQGVTPLLGEDTAKVTYVVFDKANNMASCIRTVRYRDYKKPSFSLRQAPVYPVNGPVMLLDRLHATDVVDGDISGNIRITSQNVNPKEPGIYSVTAQVSNSLGDTDTVKLKVVITDRSEPMVLALTDYIVYLDIGSTYEPTQYIAAGNAAAVETAGDVDTSTAGFYYVCYTYGTDTVWQTVVVH